MPPKAKQETKQEGPPKRDLSKRPELPAAAQKGFEAMKQRAKDRVFFTWDQDDQAVVQILGRANAQTSVGESVLFTAYYQSGNIHGTGAGAPEEVGKDFKFWGSTVLETQFNDLDVRPGDSVAIYCLGDRKGGKRVYKDFLVEVVGRAKREQIAAPDTPELEEGAE